EAASHRRLQVEPENGDYLSHGPGTLDQIVEAEAVHTARTQQDGVVPQITSQGRLRHSLPDGPHGTRYGDNIPVSDFLPRDVENRLEQAHIPDGELGRVYSHREATRSRIQVVACQGP